MFKEIELHLEIILNLSHSIMNTTGRICLFNQEINKQVFPIIITKSKEVQLLLMFHYRFVVATQVS